MTAEHDNAIRNVARTLLTELRSKKNNLTYRQLLDKHSAKIAPFVEDLSRGWCCLATA